MNEKAVDWATVVHMARRERDQLAAEVESLRAADADRRRAMCKALAIPCDTDWDGVLADARSASIVRDAEYRATDRLRKQIESLRAALRDPARAEDMT